MNLFARITPLLVKNGILKLIYENSSRGSTTTLSNLGAVDVEPEFKPYFEGFRFLLPASPGEPVKCTACAFDGVLALNITTLLEKNPLIRYLVQHLVKAGVPITLESNGEEDEAL